ncbi:hypothetical protein ACNQGB_02255 [Flavobacterium sp. XS1P32]|uniref:hypothetical protein n=1 Tax=Flavobacterium sp. XS1P32 TaxID=3401726 RepID=UPI003AADA56B
MTFNYLPSVNVIEPGLIESRYARFTSNVSVADNHSLGGAFYTSMGQRSVIACGTGSSVDSYCEISGFNNLYQNIYYLNSITTPNETIYLSNESRLDNISKMKLKELEVKNIFNQRVKHFSFDYDYFLSGSGNTKRLKLTSITEEGNNPYLFDYNAGQLPDKNSYSIDYWGFYNGHPNTSFKPDLTDLGYPEYKENVNNDFNSKINFTKAGSLERVIYPTKGYTLFEYETHQFDNLLYSAGGNPTIINTGGGLRIKNVTNFNFDNTISEKTNYEYFGGKSISKKLLAKGVSESVFTGSGPTNTYYSSAIISNLNNYISYTSSSEPDYIGYDKVVVKKIGATNNGKVEKQYSNYENSVINPENGFNYNAFSYSKTSNIENGKVLEEKIVNSDDVLQNKTVFTYFNKIFNEGFYGMAKQSNGVGITDYVGHGTGQYVYNYYPRTLAIFYAIRGRTTFLESEVKTEYFNSNTKTITTNYKYNNNMLTSVANQEFNANFQEINVSENHTSYSFYNRPVYKSSAINNTLTNVQRFSYDKITDYNFQLKKLESFPNGNFSINKDIMYYDLYDDKNNLKQFHQENGYNTCVVWGYNKTLPIAKIENVTYSQIQPYVDAIQAASNTNNENGLLAALSTFRNTLGSLFQDVMVTTYTHIPLVGTSTITDPKGETTSYSYDSFRRLQFVKDKKGNILSENEYHYKN